MPRKGLLDRGTIPHHLCIRCEPNSTWIPRLRIRDCRDNFPHYSRLCSATIQSSKISTPPEHVVLLLLQRSTRPACVSLRGRKGNTRQKGRVSTKYQKRACFAFFSTCLLSLSRVCLRRLSFSFELFIKLSRLVFVCVLGAR